MTSVPREVVETKLTELFDAERTVRRLHEEIARTPEETLIGVLVEALRAASRQPGEAEATLRLVKLAHLLAELSGPTVVDALIDILGTSHPEARHAAGDALEAMAFERFKEVALGIERALLRMPAGSPALRELPDVVVDIPEPGVTRLLGQFLEHADAQAVAAAIEALVDQGDPRAAELLAPLEEDARTVELIDESTDGSALVTIGELASEARSLLAGVEDAR